jgi:hypothetical protein
MATATPALEMVRLAVRSNTASVHECAPQITSDGPEISSFCCVMISTAAFINNDTAPILRFFLRLFFFLHTQMGPELRPRDWLRLCSRVLSALVTVLVSHTPAICNGRSVCVSLASLCVPVVMQTMPIGHQRYISRLAAVGDRWNTVVWHNIAGQAMAGAARYTQGAG